MEAISACLGAVVSKVKIRTAKEAERMHQAADPKGRERSLQKLKTHRIENRR
jgi:hypothetical protein